MFYLPVLSFMTTQVLKVMFFIILFISDILILNIDARYAILAVIGSLSGGLVLTYFEKPSNLIDKIVKVLVSGISSLFLSPAFIKWREIESVEYAGLTFFIMSLLAVFFLRALIAVTKKNVGDIITNVFTKFVSVKEIKPKTIKDKGIKQDVN